MKIQRGTNLSLPEWNITHGGIFLVYLTAWAAAEKLISHSVEFQLEENDSQFVYSIQIELKEKAKYVDKHTQRER